LPFLIKRVGLWRSVLFGATVGIALMLMYLPFYSNDLIAHNLDSFSLYFANFEFNASIYYLIREAGFYVKGYNIIAQTAVWLPRVVLISILLLAFFNKDRKLSSLPLMMFFAWIIYYALATTVHPWYITVVAMFLPFIKWRFGLVWMVLIPLSYHAYGIDAVQQNLWLTALQYTLVYGWFFFELRRTIKTELQKPST
ncbi:MAG: hypothetical protein JKX84_02325, partial [Flavobacteriales bacterium]|nr:hypothetical protein [Flavobacteriales bacterium]